MSLRLVSKKTSQAATQIFQSLHTPIRIDSEDKIFDFNEDMETSFNFPFTRFRVILEPIKRHLLITFSSAYVGNIKKLWIEPCEREKERMNANSLGSIAEPTSQRLLWKITGILEKTTDIEELVCPWFIVYIVHSVVGFNLNYFEIEVHRISIPE
jgi:hypothetical protein